MNTALRILTCICVLLPVLSAAPATSPDPLASLRVERPRLLATADQWTQQMRRADHDPQLRRLGEGILAQAETLLTTPVVTREMTGRRMLSVSRNVLRRTLQLVTAHHLTGNASFARRAEQELLAVAAFPDWNPSHFLDVAEMTTAVAIGYDELFTVLPPASRDTLREAIIRLGLRPGLDPQAPHNRWHDTPNNWNQVCWAGMILGALAIADSEADLAREILQAARGSTHHGLAPYAPDGLYPEGPGYWAYGTTYQVLMIEALRHATGQDWALPASEGFLASATAISHLTGPTGMSFNFSDGWESVGFAPALFWFARESRQPDLLNPHRRNLAAWLQHDAADRFTPLAFLWWTPLPASAETAALPLAWRSAGKQPVAAFRSSWSDPNATFLTTKGGSPSLNHGHMDMGSFILEADGVRWGRDLGAQDYSGLEAKGIDLWNRAQDSQRWLVFRLNNHSHSTLVIDDQPMRVDGHATIDRFSAGAEPWAILNLTPVYAGQATSARRGFRLDQHRRVLVQDELSGLRPGADVRWALVTGASIEIADDGRSARLEQDNRSLQVTLLSPDSLRFKSIPAAPPDNGFDAPNPNRRLLVLHATAPDSGRLELTVLMAPGSTPGEMPAGEFHALADW